MKYISHIIGFILIGSWIPINAQGIDYDDVLIDRYNINNGFNSGQGLCIGQDDTDYLWIGTETGLMRYDGHTFKKFTHDVNNENTIPSNYISSLIIDIHNRMWLVSGDALTLFNLKDYTFTNTNIKHDQLRLHYDKECDIMYIYSSVRIYSNEGINLDIKPLTFNSEIKPIRNINTLKNGNLLIASLDFIFTYNKSNKHLEKQIIRTKSKVDILCSLVESDSIVWFGNWSNGLLKYHIHTNKFEQYLFSKSGLNIIDNIAPNKQNKDLLWLATSNGIQLFNKNSLSFSSLYSNEERNDKIGGAGFSIYNTNDAVWFGTYKGLYKLDAKKQWIKTIRLNSKANTSLSKIQHIWFEPKSEKDSIIYIKFDYGDLIKYDLINHKTILWDKTISKYFSKESEINSSLYTLEESFYISSLKYGFLKIDLKTNKVTKYSFANNINPRVTEIYTNKKQPIYLSTTNGSFILDEEKAMIVPNIAINAYLDKQKMKGILSTPTDDLEGNKWYIFCNSLDCQVLMQNMKSEKIQLFTSENCKAIKKMKVINNKTLNKNGKVYFSSFNGFAYSQSLNGKHSLEYMKSDDVRYNRGVQDIISVDNTLWLSTDFGIMWYRPSSNNLVDLNYYNSKIGSLPSPGIFYSTNTNNIYISQINQLNVLDPRNYKNLGSYKLAISDMSINGRKIMPLPKHGELIPIGSDDHDIRIEFTNLNFTNSNENIYQYHTPEDTIWRDLPSNSLNFEKLPHGLNTFYIRAISNFAFVSKNIFELKLDVEPKFYYRWWFIAFCLGLITLIIYLIFKYRDNQRLKLENIRFNIARDLHDDMGSTLTQIKMLSEYEAIKSKHPNFQLISQKLAEVMNSMSEIVWSINPKYDTLSEVILKIQEFAIEGFESKDVNLKFDIHPYNEKMKIDAEQKRHLYLIFKEAINNCIKYSKAKNVKFKIAIVHNKLHISLMDDGIGFDPKLIKYGEGLKNMENRAKALGGSLVILSDNIGTTITLAI